MAEKVASFRFVGYRITKSTILMDAELEISDDLDVEFAQSGAVNEAENRYRHTLNIIIRDKNNAIDINIEALGFFEFEKELGEEERARFFRINAPAIIFPYIRAYVSSITSLSGIKPLILPTLNLAQRQ